MKTAVRTYRDPLISTLAHEDICMNVKQLQMESKDEIIEIKSISSNVCFCLLDGTLIHINDVIDVNIIKEVSVLHVNNTSYDHKNAKNLFDTISKKKTIAGISTPKLLDASHVKPPCVTSFAFKPTAFIVTSEKYEYLCIRDNCIAIPLDFF